MVVVAAILYKLVVLEEEKTYAWKFSSSFIIYVGTWYDQYKYCVFLIIMDEYYKKDWYYISYLSMLRNPR